ncbi:mating-type HMG-box protein MAT1-2 [Aspergillus luchuensis]|uniref:Mating-type HMG-box protein MAT1-2 n=1 Tax=Aspergillus kawachii TaxID=1069201 RepID=A0A146FD04_ASPKA|nr:mating-type HMG-box protein MAT1-2 [Aspergillus luchuensis]
MANSADHFDLDSSTAGALVWMRRCGILVAPEAKLGAGLPWKKTAENPVDLTVNWRGSPLRATLNSLLFSLRTQWFGLETFGWFIPALSME